MKKTVSVNLTGLYSQTVDGFVDQLKKRIEWTLQQNPTATITGIDLTSYHEYGDEYSCIEVTMVRDETEKEAAQREASEAQRLVWERKHYESLKKKFEG